MADGFRKTLGRNLDNYIHLHPRSSGDYREFIETSRAHEKDDKISRDIKKTDKKDIQ
jgi:hypothetical protein